MTDSIEKQEIKKFITRLIKGKVEQTEFQNSRRILLNYNFKEWQDLKIIGEELTRELIGEKINKLPNNKISSEQKKVFLEFANSSINLFFSIFDGEVWCRLILLENNEKGLTNEQKLIKIFPIITRQIDKVVTRNSSNLPSNYHKVEKNLVGKVNKLVNKVQLIFLKNSFDRDKTDSGEEEIEKIVNEAINILENLTLEEIIVLKEKVRVLTNKAADDYLPAKIKNSLEIRQLINSSINLIHVLSDEKLLKDTINLGLKILKPSLKNLQIQNLSVKFCLESLLQSPEMMGEAENLLRKITQHINKLAKESEQNNNPLSAEKKEEIIQKLTKGLSNNNSNGKFELGDIKKGLENLIGNLDYNSKPDKEFDITDFLKNDVKNVFTNVQSEEKWYKNPLIIGSSIIGSFLLGGLIVLIFKSYRKSKNRV